MLTSVYVCEVDFAGFTFEAVDVSSAKARTAVRKALEAHCEQFDMAPKAWRNYLTELPVRRLKLGAGYRDDYRLAEPA